MEIDQRIPDLSDKELERLHANAVRLAESGAQIQRQQAVRLLPLLGAALEQRRLARIEAQMQARRGALRRKPAADAARKEKSE
jgi:hypothetical protein